MIPIASTIVYTQKQFNDDILNLCDQLRHGGHDLIVGINRGGCIPAVCLSHNIKIPCSMIDFSTRDGVNIMPENLSDYFAKVSQQYKTILLVDDLVDSGVSLSKVVDVANQYCNVEVAVLLHNIDVDVGVPVYSGTKFSRETEPRYFDFWWEQY